MHTLLTLTGFPVEEHVGLAGQHCRQIDLSHLQKVLITYFTVILVCHYQAITYFTMVQNRSGVPLPSYRRTRTTALSQG